MATRSPRRRSAGTTPARTSDDFPLPDAPDTARKPRAGEPGERRADVGIPPEELVLVLDAERLQPSIGAGDAGDGRRLAEVERVVVAQDAELELRELRAGFHAELVGEALPCRADRASASAWRPLR